MVWSDKTGSRINRPVKRQANPGKKPSNATRKLIEKAVKENRRFTPQEIRAVLDNKVPLDEIIWVMNQ